MISGDDEEKGEVDSRAVVVKKMKGNEDAVIQYPDLIKLAGNIFFSIQYVISIKTVW